MATSPTAGLSRETRARTSWHGVLAGLVLLWALAGALPVRPLLATEAPPGPTIDVDVRDGRLWISALNAPLAEVLRAIAERAGIRVVLGGDLGEPITRSLSDVALDRGLRRLVGDGADAALVMIYGPAGDDPRPLVEVWVYGSRSGDRPSRPPGPSTPSEPASQTDGMGRDPAARIQAIRALAGLRDARAIQAIGQLLATDADPAVRRHAVTALSEIGGEGAAVALESGLGDDDPGVRRLVVEALGNIGGERATLGLGQVLFGERDPEIRTVALEQLAVMRSDPARAFLEAAARDPDDSVRHAAELALEAWK